MSYDCIITFETFDQKQNFIKQIKMFKINESKLSLFLVEDYDDLKRIFVRMNYYGNERKKFIFNNKIYEFGDNFDTLAKRTGRHIQRCDVITSKKIKNNDIIFNQDLNKIFID